MATVERNMAEHCKTIAPVMTGPCDIAMNAGGAGGGGGGGSSGSGGSGSGGGDGDAVNLSAGSDGGGGGKKSASGRAPRWDEDIVINEEYSHFLRPNVLILAELLDFGAGQAMVKKLRAGQGMYRIAWGFLRPVGPAPDFTPIFGTNDNPAAVRKGMEVPDPAAAGGGKPLRLQLYRYTDDQWLGKAWARKHGVWNVPDTVPAVFTCFMQRHRVRYPSTLFLRVGPATPWKRPQAVLRRAMHPMEVEAYPVPLEQLEQHVAAFGMDQNDVDEAPADEVVLQKMKRQRGRFEACLVPARGFRRLPVGGLGAFRVAFSKPEGTYFAAACADGHMGPQGERGQTDGTFTIKVFDADTCTERFALGGHFGLIHDLSFHGDDREHAPGGGGGGGGGDSSLRPADAANGPSSSPGGVDGRVRQPLCLVTASADGTAKVWRIPRLTGFSAGGDYEPGQGSPSRPPGKDAEAKGDGPPAPAAVAAAAAAAAGGGGGGGIALIADLYHDPPLFVYSARCHPTASPGLAATGASDGAIRLWGVSPAKQGRRAGRGQRRRGRGSAFDDDDDDDDDGNGNGASRKCLGILGRGRKAHAAAVNCLLFDRSGGRLFSGDAAGVINVWRCYGDPAKADTYRVIKTIDHPDLRGKAITSLSIEPTTQRSLLVTGHRNYMGLFQLKTYGPLSISFSGMQSGRAMIRGGYSPDGRFVYAGSTQVSV